MAPSSTKASRSAAEGSAPRRGTAALRREALAADRLARAQQDAAAKERMKDTRTQKRAKTPPHASSPSVGRLSKASRQGGSPMKEDRAPLVEGDITDEAAAASTADDIELPAMEVDATKLGEAAPPGTPGGRTTTTGETPSGQEGTTQARPPPTTAEGGTTNPPSGNTAAKEDDAADLLPHSETEADLARAQAASTTAGAPVFDEEIAAGEQCKELPKAQGATTPGVRLKSARKGASGRGRSSSASGQGVRFGDDAKPSARGRSASRSRSRGRSKSAGVEEVDSSDDDAPLSSRRSSQPPRRRSTSRSVSRTRLPKRQGGQGTGQSYVDMTLDDDEDREETFDKWKKVARRGGRSKRKDGSTLPTSRTAAATPTPPTFTHDGFLEIIVFVAAGTAKSDILPAWQDAIAAILERYQAMPGGEGACIIHPTKDDTRLYSREDFPEFFKVWTQFASFESTYVLSMPAPADKSRKIVCTLRFGFNEPVEEFVRDAQVDMATVENVQVFYKKIQEWATMRDLYLMWSAASTSMVEFTKKVHTFLSDCERTFCGTYPHEFELQEHGGEFPPIEVRLDWGRGGSFNQRPKDATEDDDTTHRKVPTIIYPTSAGARILRVVSRIKSQGLEKREFGDHAFFQYQLTRMASEDERERFNEKLILQGSIQKSLASGTLTGLTRPEYKVTVELYPDGDGPRQSPGDLSIADILRKLRSPCRRFSLFQGIFREADGSFRAFYAGDDEGVKIRVGPLLSDLAGNLRFYLQRQGWKWDTINHLIKKSFTPTAAHNARLARYDKRTRRVISGAAVRHEQDLAVLDRSFVRRDLGLTSWERREKEEREAAEKAAADIRESEFGPDSWGAFDFGDDQSAKTKLSSRTARTEATYQFDATSKFSIDSQDEEMAFSSDDEGGSSKQPEVVLEFGEEGEDGEDVSFGGRDDARDPFDPDEPGCPTPSNLDDRFAHVGEDGRAVGGEETAGGSGGDRTAGATGSADDTLGQSAAVFAEMTALREQFAQLTRRYEAARAAGYAPPDEGNREETAGHQASPSQEATVPQQGSVAAPSDDVAPDATRDGEAPQGDGDGSPSPP